jgi:hypothetical protein
MQSWPVLRYVPAVTWTDRKYYKETHFVQLVAPPGFELSTSRIQGQSVTATTEVYNVSLSS